MEVQPQHHVRPPRTRANRPEVITSRGRIIGYHEAGKGLREISRLLGISRDTVRLWVRRYEEEGHVLTRPRPGRPRVTTPAADQQIQRAAERAPLSTAISQRSRVLFVSQSRFRTLAGWVLFNMRTAFGDASSDWSEMLLMYYLVRMETTICLLPRPTSPTPLQYPSLDLANNTPPPRPPGSHTQHCETTTYQDQQRPYEPQRDRWWWDTRVPLNLAGISECEELYHRGLASHPLSSGHLQQCPHPQQQAEPPWETWLPCCSTSCVTQSSGCMMVSVASDVEIKVKEAETKE
ncbi:putative helix-turn-helix HTH_28 domain containing protein 8, partial [Homarus americanus]